MTATQRKQPRVFEVATDDIEKALEEAKASLSERNYEILSNLAEAYAYVTELVEDKRTSIERLRRLLFGAKSEKTSKVLDKERDAASAGDAPAPSGGEGGVDSKGASGERKKRKGHGRNGADAYPGAEKIEVRHQALKSGDACPGCSRGKVYRLRDPGVIVRFQGQAPLQGRIYELEKLRCNLCLEVFTARAPEGVGEKKYDATAGAMIAYLRYGAGLPHNRLQKLQKAVGMPVPASTQWEVVKEAAEEVVAVYEELLGQAAQGEVIHNDDTPMKVLELMKENEERARKDSQEGSEERTGIFTTGLVSRVGDHRIALFKTGRKHAGENFSALLERREAGRGAPIQMCDGLARNAPRDFEVILANCMAHARRYFVEEVENFPAECRVVLELLKGVYRNEALARQRELSAVERLAFHQAESGPLMEELKRWLEEQLVERKVEPNSGLGRAIAYMRERWEPLTLFLREPGAPLDNNIVEQALKMAIRHRRNSLFYKTLNGARVGDVFMTLIHTAELEGVDPFDYLTELLRHAAAVAKEPAAWLPWNYKETLRARAARAPP